MTLIEAQDRYITRVTNCHPGHSNRVRRSAWAQLFTWAIDRGFSPAAARGICRDARDMARLEMGADEPWMQRAQVVYRECVTA